MLLSQDVRVANFFTIRRLPVTTRQIARRPSSNLTILTLGSVKLHVIKPSVLAWSGVTDILMESVNLAEWCWWSWVRCTERRHHTCPQRPRVSTGSDFEHVPPASSDSHCTLPQRIHTPLTYSRTSVKRLIKLRLHTGASIPLRLMRKTSPPPPPPPSFPSLLSRFPFSPFPFLSCFPLPSS